MRNERGNSILEMLLFAPLALFFIVVVIDVALSLRDRSGVIDALRSAVNAHAASLPILQTYNPTVGFDRGEQLSFLTKLAVQINDGILRSRGGHSVSASKLPYVRVALVKVDIDTLTGAVTTSSIEQPEIFLNDENNNRCGTSNLEQEVRNKVVSAGVSPYALPVANVYNSNGARYADRAYLLAAQVCSRAIGLSGEAAQAMAGKIFDFHEEQVLPLRVQPNAIW